MSPLRQTLYLGASIGEGIWVQTPPGQVIPLLGGGSLDAPEGWWHSVVLEDFLAAVNLAVGDTGFPTTSAPSEGTDQTLQPVTPNPDPPQASEAGVGRRTRVLLGLAALGLLLLVGAIESRPGGLGAINPAPE